MLIERLFKKIDMRILIGIIAIVLAGLFFFKWFIIVFLFIAALIVSFVIGKSNMRSIGIELVAFTTIITGFLYGATAGIIIGLVLIIFHLVISGFFGIYILWTIPEYSFIGYLAAAMSTQPISSVGIILVLGINIFSTMISFALFRGNVIKHLPWVLTNIIFNVILFMFGAPLLVNFLR